MQFSIITPSYRSSSLLRCCIPSVADQHVELEHLVQDAGSDDGTLDWLPDDSRVQSFIEKDQGMYDAINRGLRRARGEVVAWLNCDEQYLPGTLEAVSRFFTDHPDVDVVFGHVVMVNPEGRYLCHRRVETPLLHHTWVCHLSTLSCAMFFRRRLVAPGGFLLDTSYRAGGDGEWMVRLLRAGVRMATLDRFASTFTVHEENLSRSDIARQEWRRLRNTAPLWVRNLSPAWIVQHRLQRMLGGNYRQQPFEFAVYTTKSLNCRVTQAVTAPTFRCP